jgi:glycosyltransferase involved in cell wall biosynthesis
VITSREASLPEVAGEAAYYVDAYSEENIAKGIREVFHSDSLQKDLSEKGQKQAAKFSWEKCARDTYTVYEKVYRSSKK